ncbi:MAG: hypothetical protein MZW92_54265 [Comamonadaceae bacterium]|nr:hypothetical protein [Comamonadaceae bacterium]
MRAIIAMARSLKLRVVAEGVETRGPDEPARRAGLHRDAGLAVRQGGAAGRFRDAAACARRALAQRGLVPQPIGRAAGGDAWRRCAGQGLT